METCSGSDSDKHNEHHNYALDKLQKHLHLPTDPPTKFHLPSDPPVSRYQLKLK